MSLYVRLQTEILTDEKILAAGPEAFTVWARGLCYSKQHLTDGFIPEGALTIVGLGVRNRKRAIKTLLDLGLWETCEGGYTVGSEKWARHQTTKEQVESERESNAERQRRYREKLKAQREAKDQASRNASSNGVTNTSRNETVTQPEYRARAQSTEPEHINIPPTPQGAETNETDRSEMDEPPLERLEAELVEDDPPDGDIETRFAEFLEVYPKGANANPQGARASFNHLAFSNVDLAEVIAGAERYAKSIRAQGKEGSTFVMSETTFLREAEKNWLRPWEAPPPAKGHGSLQDRQQRLQAVLDAEGA